MSRTGLTKVIGGKTYRLAGQYVGRGAKKAAYGEAAWLRGGYPSVRVITVGPGWYRVYYLPNKRP